MDKEVETKKEVVGEEEIVLEDNPLFKAMSENDKPVNKDENDEGDDEELEPKEGDSPEVLQTKLTAKSRMVRQREKAIGRQQKQIDELTQKLEKNKTGGITAEQLATVLQAKTEKSSEEQNTEFMEKFTEQFNEDPIKAVTGLMSDFETKVASVLDKRDQYFLGKLAAAEKSKIEVSPEIQKMVEVLKKHPDFKDFEDNKLVVVAKSLIPLAGRVKGSRPPALTKTGTVLPIGASDDDVLKKHKSALDAMGYGDDDN